jgi:Cytochrome c554 and c-prime
MKNLPGHFAVRGAPVAFRLLFAVLLASAGAASCTSLDDPDIEESESPLSVDILTAQSCAGCHADIKAQWDQSFHARATTSETMIVETNQVASARTLGKDSPDPENLCNNCHAPFAVKLGPKPTLPLSGPLGHEGVTCVSCHAYNGEPGSGAAGLSTFAKNLKNGSTMFGTFNSNVPNSRHRSAKWSKFKEGSQLCKNCHDVNYDRNGDGEIEKGVDLVLQTTAREYDAYREEGGERTCIDCHMPSLGKGSIGPGGPVRERHSHAFVGVDVPWEKPEQADVTQARRALLRSAAEIRIEDVSIEDGELKAEIEVENVGTGHNLPTGFAFARQLWLEVTARTRNGNVVASSGLLRASTDDLCDTETRDDALFKFTRGCLKSDSQLTNLQLKLITAVDIARDDNEDPVKDGLDDNVLESAEDARETVLQCLNCGAVARERPETGDKLAPLAPGESRKFAYRFGVGNSRGALLVRARLLLRPLAPYFIRTLNERRAPGEPDLSPMLNALPVDELGVAEASVSP